VTAYCSISRETTIEGVATRIAASVLQAIELRKPLFEKMVKGLKSMTAFRPAVIPSQEDGFSFTLAKAPGVSGIQLLEEVMGQLVMLEKGLDKGADYPICIAIDEFQTVASIDPHGTAEALMRDLIQNTQVSFYFVGSQRHMLKSMFSDSGRPFYRMCHNLELFPLENQDMAPYILDLVSSAGGDASGANALLLATLSRGIPFFLQKIGYVAFQEGSGAVDETSIKEAFRQVMDEEKNDLEAMFSRMSSMAQKTLLIALSTEPTTGLYAQEYMQRHGLTSSGAITSAIEALIRDDFVVQDGKLYKVADPFMEMILSDRISSTFEEALHRANDSLSPRP
jgi:hypothetical protein